MMIELDADSYIVSETELKIMLAGLRFDCAFGLFSPEEQTRGEETRENVLKTIVSMLSDGKISLNKDVFSINKPLEEIVRIIGEAKRSSLMHIFAQESQMCCYFAEQTAVICETVAYQPKMFRLSMASKEAVAQRIVDSEIYPEGYESRKSDESRALWEKSSVTVFSAEFFNDGEPGEKLEVTFPAVGQAEIAVSGEGTTVCTFPFDKGAFYECLLGLMGRP